VRAAQTAGAIAAVVINNVGGGNIVMGGNANNINIPSVMISKANGDMIKNQMTTKDVTVTMYDSSSGGGIFYYDSDFDNGIIVHEYGHGISARLTGGPSNSSCLTGQEQMGEGWSDFLSLVMTHDPTDKGTDKRGIGTYVRNQATNGGGIRPYPYSTSFGINPVTYDYIKQNQFTVPHGVGSVWCAMLWDLYWSFIDVYGYDPDVYEGTGGNNMVMHLVMDGLKLQPCNPGFVNGRDAILKADEALYGGKNKLLIWQAFAKRGLGYSARQGSSNSKSDGFQAFDVPPSFGGYTVSKTGPNSANAGDTILYEVTITNIGDDFLRQITLVDSLSDYGKFISSDGRCAITFTGQTFSIDFTDLGNLDSIVCGYYVLVNDTVGGKEISVEDFEIPDSNWTSTTISGNGGWARTMAKSNSGSFSYFINNPASESDRTLSAEFDLTNTAEPHLVFSHLYNTEATWDGAVVELKVNGSWKDLGGQMIQNGYNDFIENNPVSAIKNRPAFTGNSESFIRTVVDLLPYAGNVVEIRFRFASDGLQGGEGWYIDDVELWNGFGTILNKISVEADGLLAKQDQVLTSILNVNVKDTVIIIIDVNEELVVFPNPAGNNTKIRFGSKVERSLDLELNDMTGHQIWEGSVASQTTTEIPLTGLADGMYILSVTDKEEVRHFKLIKRSR
jgi:extracellular elastinolytic metalloproteinase